MRVIVVTAEGDYFSGGADVNIFLNIGAHAPGDIMKVGRLYEPLRACDKTTIAVVQGHAVGMGVTILPHFDLVYAADHVTFTTPFVKLGLVLEYGSAYTLSRLIGISRAKELILRAAPLDARTAASWGLVTHLRRRAAPRGGAPHREGDRREPAGRRRAVQAPHREGHGALVRRRHGGRGGSARDALRLRGEREGDHGADGAQEEGLMRASIAISLALLVACGGPESPDAGADAGADAGTDAGPPVIVLPDDREPCRDRNPLRNPYFGDLHVHTSLSFDANAYGTRTRPDDAYRFARGEAIDLPPYDASGAATRTARIDRPLDFAAVTDHAEFFAEVDICTDPTSPGYDSGTCRTYREGDPSYGDYGELTNVLIMPSRAARVCQADPGLCAAREASVWGEIQEAAERHYDRSAECAFTTFVGYEWTGTATGTNLHRNIIFRGRSVQRVPVSYRGRDHRRGAVGAAGGHLPRHRDAVRPPLHPAQREPRRRAHVRPGGGGRLALHARGERAARRARAAHRDLPAQGRERVRGRRELAARERGRALRLRAAPLEPLHGQPERSRGLRGRVPRRRHRLPRLLHRALGSGARPPARGPGRARAHGREPPSRWASSAAPTRTWRRRAAWPRRASPATRARPTTSRASSSASPDGPLVRGLTASAGGLAGDLGRGELARGALRRHAAPRDLRDERPAHGGALLRRVELPRGRLRSRRPARARLRGRRCPWAGASRPRRREVRRPSSSSALRDALGAPLERIQIVKGWYDGVTTHEQVFDVGGDPGGVATVDERTCAPSGEGFDALCGAWTDPEFDPSQPAFYYARVIQAPTCRWTRYACNDAGVDCASVDATHPLWACCDPSVSHVVRERAWTSPIFYLPG
ncbi:MAG: DUF3604 domain-containing protein [Sandaracinaceae bacterium]|nr:DUF3604 domain-containing protein [Sandaracinaceae bacterium]